MRAPSIRVALPFAIFALSLSAISAFASDGVLEINQTCARDTGCFTGDTSGFPVTIDGSAGHSYRLTSDLIVNNKDTDGIVVSTSDVGIDLNNFAIRGPVTCSGSPPVCTPASGTGSGVERTSTSNRGISVKHGTITGMGDDGVQLGDQAEVTNLRVRWSHSNGITVGAGSTVSGNTVYENGLDGINASSGSTVSANALFRNGSDGISGTTGSTVLGNTAYQNGFDGITVGAGSTVSGNTAYQNADGIHASSGSTASANTAYQNDNDGIDCSLGCLVFGNTVRGNSDYGLNLNTDSAYANNVVTSNTLGTVTGAGSANARGGNYCSGQGTVSANCP
jgi:parallel beta-helix repeat protein